MEIIDVSQMNRFGGNVFFGRDLIPLTWRTIPERFVYFDKKEVKSIPMEQHSDSEATDEDY